MRNISWLVVKRLVQAAVSLLVVLVLVFMLVRLTGDPARYLLGPNHPPEDLVRLREEMGLNDPFLDQLIAYIGDVLSGDLGYSFRLGLEVNELLLDRIGATLQMGLAALLITLLVAVPLGISAAYHRAGIVDRIARFFAALGQSVPQFWFGILLILVVSVRFDWLPSGGYGSWAHLILPALTLALEPMARVTRLLRSSMIEQLNSDYIKFHRIKGLPEHLVLWKHGLRNAGLTTLTFIGVMTASLFTGSVLVETVFVWPGIGRLLVEAISNRDFPLIQGVMLVIALGFIVINLLVDLMYMVLNPRLRVQ